MKPTINVGFIYTGKFVTELELRKTDSNGEPESSCTVPVRYTAAGYVEFISLVVEMEFGVGPCYPVNYVVVDSGGFATVYEDDFHGLVSDWLEG